MPTAFLLCLYRDGMPVRVCVSPTVDPGECVSGERWDCVCEHTAEQDEREYVLDLCATVDPSCSTYALPKRPSVDDFRARRPTAKQWRDSFMLRRIAEQPLAVRRAIARMGEKRCGQPVLVSDFVEGLAPAARNELAVALAATEAHAVMIVEVEKRQVSGTSEMAQWRNADDVRRIAELEAQIAAMKAKEDNALVARGAVEAAEARRWVDALLVAASGVPE